MIDRATYKATVRRNGVFAGAAGARDFNAELFEPISRNLATGWERAFQRRLPTLLTSFAARTKKLLNDFHQAARARAAQRHTNVTAMYTLGNQILAHIRSLEDLPNVLKATITELQRDASREFTPKIMEAMMYAYEACSAESGKHNFLLPPPSSGRRFILFSLFLTMIRPWTIQSDENDYGGTCG